MMELYEQGEERIGKELDIRRVLQTVTQHQLLLRLLLSTQQRSLFKLHRSRILRTEVKKNKSRSGGYGSSSSSDGALPKVDKLGKELFGWKLEKPFDKRLLDGVIDRD